MKKIKTNRLITIVLIILLLFTAIRFAYKKIISGKVINNPALTSFSFNKDSIINLGKLNPNQKKSFAFSIKNTGAKKLYIVFIEATCGCTAINTNKKNAAIGDSINFEGVIDTEVKSGKNLSIIHFKANTLQQKHQFVIKYTVE